MRKVDRKLRVVLLSSTRFGYRCLDEALMHTPEIEMVGILTTPSEIDISYSATPLKLTTHSSFIEIADQMNCPVVELTGRLKSRSYLEHIEKWQPDLTLALGWYYIIPRKVRQGLPLGCMGIHASLLPGYRGGAPIPWAIINGEKETGVTLFQFDDGVDTGDIFAQRKIKIEDHDDCATVYDKATRASTGILKNTLPEIARKYLAGDEIRGTKQDESQTTVFPQRKPEDGLIDWSRSSKEIYNFIRAQTHPYPGAFTHLASNESKRLYIWKAALGTTNMSKRANSIESQPGRLQLVDNKAAVMTGNGCLFIERCQFENDRESDNPVDYLNLRQNNNIVLQEIEEI